MARNSKQENALRRCYAAKKDETRSAFEQALASLATDPAAAVTERALYQAAGRSRATLNRYPDIKARLAEIRRERELERSAMPPASPPAKEVTAAARLRQAQAERDVMAQRVAILSLIVEDLGRHNSALVRLLNQSRVAVPLELVARNDDET